jgi:RAP1 GTPase activating protein 1
LFGDFFKNNQSNLISASVIIVPPVVIFVAILLYRLRSRLAMWFGILKRDGGSEENPPFSAAPLAAAIQTDRVGNAEPSDKEKHRYIEGPEDYEVDPENPPVILPTPGFRVELGGSIKTVEDVFLEKKEKNSSYFKDHFYGKKHANYLGGDRNKPVVVSVSFEPVNGQTKTIVRTKYDDFFITIPSSQIKARMFRSLIKSLPEFANIKLKENKDEALSKKLLHMEDRLLVKAYKFGVVYCKEGQTDENDMFSNCDESPQFQRFLELIGDRVRMKGFQGFRGGLDIESDATGAWAYHTHFEGMEILYHVSTLLPYTENNRQQVERKRHIGNDVVVLIFQDGPTPFNPACVTSKFNHVYAVVQYDPVRSVNGRTFYKFAIASKTGVGPHGPVLPENPIFEHGPAFRTYLLTKLINAERAAYYAPGFMQVSTRRDWLREILAQFGPKSSS